MRLAFARTHESGFTLKGQQDHLTQTDGEAQAVAKAAITEAFPRDGFFVAHVWFVAALRRGVFFNGERMHTSAATELKQATVEVGWNKRLATPDFVRQLAAVIDAGASIRKAGSGALGLAYVAAGRCDAYVELHINAWDVAAGLLLVTEAGGVVNDFWTPGALKHGNPVLACAPFVAQEMSEVAQVPL